MRVLIINTVCGTGSTGKISQDQYWELRRQGYECKVAWGRKKVGNIPDSDTIQIGTMIDCWIHALSTRIFDNAGFCSTRATKKFIRTVEKYNPDVIYLHNLHGYYLNIQILFEYLKKCHKRIYWTLHDCWSFTGHCAYMTYAQCSKWKSGCNHCPQKRYYPTSYFFDRSKLNFCLKKKIFTDIPNLQLITPSNWLAGLVKQSYLHDYPIVVKRNNIDRNIFKPSSSNIIEKYNISGFKIILCVANVWDVRKGFDDILRLSDIMQDCKIVVIGLTKKQKKMIERKNNVIGIQRTEDQKELAAWYTVATVFFNPTKEDNLPTVNLEAEACGTPVITYDVGGCRETVTLYKSKVVKTFEEAVVAINNINASNE